MLQEFQICISWIRYSARLYRNCHLSTVILGIVSFIICVLLVRDTCT